MARDCSRGSSRKVFCNVCFAEARGSKCYYVVIVSWILKQRYFVFPFSARSMPWNFFVVICSDKVSTCILALFIVIQTLCMFKWPVFGRVGLVEKMDWLMFGSSWFSKKVLGHWLTLTYWGQPCEARMLAWRRAQRKCSFTFFLHYLKKFHTEFSTYEILSSWSLSCSKWNFWNTVFAQNWCFFSNPMFWSCLVA